MVLDAWIQSFNSIIPIDRLECRERFERLEREMQFNDRTNITREWSNVDLTPTFRILGKHGIF
jgi:hypothetical protein